MVQTWDAKRLRFLGYEQHQSRGPAAYDPWAQRHYLERRIRNSPRHFGASKKKELEVFLYGWVEYDDVFEGTPRHRTEYCTQIVVEGDVTIHTLPGNPEQPHVPFRYQGHKKHNGADEECIRPLQTGSPKNPRT
jgi:hypothetical protein